MIAFTLKDKLSPQHIDALSYLSRAYPLSTSQAIYSLASTNMLLPTAFKSAAPAAFRQASRSFSSTSPKDMKVLAVLCRSSCLLYVSARVYTERAHHWSR